MKADYFYPHIGDRTSPAEWQENGAKSVGQVARERTVELLANHYPEHIDDALDRSLRAKFDIRLTRQRIGRSE
jgi:trimethylamine---corrinoid protein Co-methyltransferase